MHAILAHLGGPHWLLSDDDAKTYARAVQNVSRHYNVETAQKTIDWCNLIGMVSFVEGTRLMAQRQARAAAKAPPPSPFSTTMPVFQFAPPTAPQPGAAPAVEPQAEGQLH